MKRLTDHFLNAVATVFLSSSTHAMVRPSEPVQIFKAGPIISPLFKAIAVFFLGNLVFAVLSRWSLLQLISFNMFNNSGFFRLTSCYAVSYVIPSLKFHQWCDKFRSSNLQSFLPFLVFGRFRLQIQAVICVLLKFYEI
jgi:hypothetical protein